MQKIILVNAEWDDEARVWVATSDDVPGLVTEAETVEALEAKLKAIIPELLELNGIDLGVKGEVPMNLIATRRENIRLRA